jgi:ubiquinone/menaquinone biosynthesis C-methylase UbiE
MTTATEARTTLSPEDYSVPGNARAAAFARFARPYLRGYVLDVGCGAAYVPLYLKRYPTENIRGVDPNPAPHPFEYWPGTAEAIPTHGWMFQTVICATTLDHVDDPAAAVREIARVLQPGGSFLSWETIMPPGEDGPDEHHAFRFTEESLTALLGTHFEQTAVASYREGMRPGCAERFSVWRPRTTAEEARMAQREGVAV